MAFILREGADRSFLLHFATNKILSITIVINKNLVKSISYVDYPFWHGKCIIDM